MQRVNRQRYTLAQSEWIWTQFQVLSLIFAFFVNRFEANFGQQTVIFSFKYAGVADMSQGPVKVTRKANRMEITVWSFPLIRASRRFQEIILFSVFSPVPYALLGPGDQNTILTIHSDTVTKTQNIIYHIILLTTDNQSNQFVVKIVPKPGEGWGMRRKK